jgi:hypothetical protein
VLLPIDGVHMLKEAHFLGAHPTTVVVVRCLALRLLVPSATSFAIELHCFLIYAIASLRSEARRSMKIVDVDEAPSATACGLWKRATSSPPTQIF